MRNRKLLIAFALWMIGWGGSLSGQILNAERFGRHLDSTDVFKGSLNANYSGARRVELISNFKTGLDFSLRWKRNEFISSGSYSWLLRGKESIRNEGFFHLRYRFGKNKARMVPETFVQIQRDAILGMSRRFISGENLRFTLQKDSLGVVYVGVGAFFENEVWDYSGVPNEAEIPVNPIPREVQFVKANFYISARRDLTPTFSAGAVAYYQARPDAFFLYPRVASEITFSFKIAKGVGWRSSFASIYDRLPIVPIYAFYFNTTTGLTIDF